MWLIMSYLTYIFIKYHCVKSVELKTDKIIVVVVSFSMRYVCKANGFLKPKFNTLLYLRTES